MDRFISVTLNGLSGGMIYAAVALSLVLIWRATRVLNFAQGAMAMFTTYLAYYVYGLGLRRVEATRAATVATLEPVVAAALAYALWGEELGAMGYAGGLLVLIGVLAIATER